MFRGDNSLGLGRPKFLSDQMFSGPLFGSTYAEPGNMHEGGPEVGAGIELGREHYGYSAMATADVNPVRNAAASQRGIIMNKIYWFVMEQCNYIHTRTLDEINVRFQNTSSTEILANQSGALRRLLEDDRLVDVDFIWKKVQTVIKDVRDAINVNVVNIGVPAMANGVFYCYVLREALRRLCPAPGAWANQADINVAFTGVVFPFIDVIHQVIFQGLRTFGEIPAGAAVCRGVYGALDDNSRPFTIKDAVLVTTHAEAVPNFALGAGPMIQFYNTLRLMLYGDNHEPTSRKIINLMMLGWNVGRMNVAVDLATTFDSLSGIASGGAAVGDHNIDVGVLFNPPAAANAVVQHIRGGIDITGANPAEETAVLVFWLAAAVQAISVRANEAATAVAVIAATAVAVNMPALCALPRAHLVGNAGVADTVADVAAVIALPAANAQVLRLLNIADWGIELHQVFAHRALYAMCQYMTNCIGGGGAVVADAGVAAAIALVDNAAHAGVAPPPIGAVYAAADASLAPGRLIASLAAMHAATNDQLNSIYNAITATSGVDLHAVAAMVVGDLYWQKFCAKLSIALTLDSVRAAVPGFIQDEFLQFVDTFTTGIRTAIDNAVDLARVDAQILAASWQDAGRATNFFRQMLTDVTMREPGTKFDNGRAIFAELLDFVALPLAGAVVGLVGARHQPPELNDRLTAVIAGGAVDNVARSFVFTLVAMNIYGQELFGHWNSQLSDVPPLMSYPPQFDVLQAIAVPLDLHTVVDVTGLRQDLPATYKTHNPLAIVQPLPVNGIIPEGSVPHYDPATGVLAGYIAVSSLDVDNIDQYYYYTPNNSGSMPKLYALFYLGQTADKMPTVKIVPLGSHPYEKKRILEAVGRMRFDTTFMRKIFFITNLFRLTRLNISRIASEFHKVIIKSHALTNPSITEYGAYPYGPNEIYENRRFDIDTEFVPI